LAKGPANRITKPHAISTAPSHEVLSLDLDVNHSMMILLVTVLQLAQVILTKASMRILSRPLPHQSTLSCFSLNPSSYFLSLDC
jgi:hypothetical protein